MLAAPEVDAQQCPSSESAPQLVAKLSLDGNNQYFLYNGQTVPLIGLSSEYLCHVDQPGTAFGGAITPNKDYCTWANYHTFIDRLATSGLNVLRLWVGLNHSPGRERAGGGVSDPTGPYANEQPFAYNSGTQKWDLNTPDTVFWDRLKCVIGYAGVKGVIVEVTLLDPWSGDWTKGPWNSARNSQAIGFSQEKYFAQFVNDPTKTDDVANSPARLEQDELIQYAVNQLKAYPNLYWEIANEADLPPGSGASAARWMDHVAQVINATEAAPRHPIGVNMQTDAALLQLTNSAANPSLATSSVVAAHYVSVGSPKGDTGAIKLIRTKSGTAGYTQRAFGFNETKSSPSPSIPTSARAEAWEFALNEGGLYDNYNLVFLNPAGTGVQSDTNKIFNQLGVLKSFLLGLGGLGSMSRDACGAGCWLGGQGTYKTLEAFTCARPDGTTWQGNKYWAAMHSPNAYVAYFHHSFDTLSPSNPFSRYEPPPCSPSYQETGITFKPDILGTYVAEWVNPVTGATLATYTLGFINAGVTVSVPSSPTYIFDMALRVKRQ